jgi:large subunit ribosomal protein L23
MKLTDVIRRPLVTEKTSMAREIGPTVVFEVHKSATRVDVKHAVEKLLGSKVASVRTSPGAVRRPAIGLEEGLGALEAGPEDS